MDYRSILTSLYYVLIGADSQLNEKELSLGKQLAKIEEIDEKKFDKQLEALKLMDVKSILSESIADLKKIETKLQIRCIAWLCVVANGDGFMDRTEWTLIYKIYHTELHLPIDEIMEVQKELNKLIQGKALQSMGVSSQ